MVKGPNGAVVLVWLYFALILLLVAVSLAHGCLLLLSGAVSMSRVSVSGMESHRAQQVEQVL